MTNIYIKDPVLTSKTAFLEDLFSVGGNYFKAKETFFDEDCIEKQCHPANRTLDDLKCIFKTYFTEDLCKEDFFDSKLLFLFFYCPNIKQPVIFAFNNKDYYRDFKIYKNIFYAESEKRTLNFKAFFGINV